MLNQMGYISLRLSLVSPATMLAALSSCVPYITMTWWYLRSLLSTNNICWLKMTTLYSWGIEYFFIQYNLCKHGKRIDFDLMLVPVDKSKFTNMIPVYPEGKNVAYMCIKFHSNPSDTCISLSQSGQTLPSLVPCCWKNSQLTEKKNSRCRPNWKKQTTVSELLKLFLISLELVMMQKKQ